MTNNYIITITYYVEAGCLGQKGQDKIIDFCSYLNKTLNQTRADFCYWQVKPLTDINQNHFIYSVHQKKLNREQATRFLDVYQQKIDTFEESTDDLVMDIIEQYLGR